MIATGVAFLFLIKGFLVALAMAAVFSVVISPLYNQIRRRTGASENVASLLTILFALVVLLVPLILLLGLIAEQAAQFSAQVGPWLDEQLTDDDGFFRGGDTDTNAEQEFVIPSWVPFADQLEPYKDTVATKIAEFAGDIGAYLGASLGRISQGTAHFFLNLLIMLYAMFYFLMRGRRWVDGAIGLVPLPAGERERLVKVAESASRATINGTVLIGLMQGLLNGLGFAVVGIQAAAFWGAIMAVLSIMPAIGTALVWLPAVLYLAINGQVAAAFGLLVWSGIVVGTLDNVVRPVLVGRQTRVPDLLIVVTTLGGISLMGMPGLVLGPMAAAMFLTAISIYTETFADVLCTEAPESESTT
jgi:predicted PurR-regulated permease PerM